MNKHKLYTQIAASDNAVQTGTVTLHSFIYTRPCLAPMKRVKILSTFVLRIHSPFQVIVKVRRRGRGGKGGGGCFPYHNLGSKWRVW